MTTQTIRCLILTTACLSISLVTDTLQAQRNSARKSKQAAAIELAIRQMDNNKNGYIDPQEMKGVARTYSERSGLDLKRSQQISKVVTAVRNKGRKPKDKGDKTDRKVPGFAIDPPERLGVPDFSPSGEERMTVDMMKRKFTASVMSQVERTMTRNDKNKSGLLETDEIAKSRWSNPTWQESDTNKDNKLSRLELAYRYQKREEDAKSKSDDRKK